MAKWIQRNYINAFLFAGIILLAPTAIYNSFEGRPTPEPFFILFPVPVAVAYGVHIAIGRPKLYVVSLALLAITTVYFVSTMAGSSALGLFLVLPVLGISVSICHLMAKVVMSKRIPQKKLGTVLFFVLIGLVLVLFTQYARNAPFSS